MIAIVYSNNTHKVVIKNNTKLIATISDSVKEITIKQNKWIISGTETKINKLIEAFTKDCKKVIHKNHHNPISLI